jgi:hypothetical protein
MRIEHVAIWIRDLEMKSFYTTYFESGVLDPEGNLVEITV